MAEQIKLRYEDRETRAPLSAKECLRVVWNSWLHGAQIARARAMAADPDVTEEQAEAYLSELERYATEGLATWRLYQ